ncbi:hypothetical protein H257_04795 [Aphanomyces astaci]|uniref:Uncharacterized protein n=1 Tax=Aphanomyces astaci TaxID=112090 RepID=W4GTQ0_APHAT|nr:hypothetical protein H257_04795 [Aphanomyces astaci]ETV83052.1 hypothetical protein H257_04795 [Aphanomyces astaci]|eukprot:XP_009827723.1 hypothetical protein H257_04795 [Aphanomyces astaci]
MPIIDHPDANQILPRYHTEMSVDLSSVGHWNSTDWMIVNMSALITPAVVHVFRVASRVPTDSDFSSTMSKATKDENTCRQSTTHDTSTVYGIAKNKACSVVVSRPVLMVEPTMPIVMLYTAVTTTAPVMLRNTRSVAACLANVDADMSLLPVHTIVTVP